MKRDQVKKGQLVKYLGVNRTYLKNYASAKTTGEFSSSNSSAFVEFFDNRGVAVETAWVGLGYLDVVSFIHQDTIDTLNKKRDELLTQAAGIDAAIDALKALG